MKKLKILPAIILVIAMVFAMAACNGGNSGNDTPAASPPAGGGASTSPDSGGSGGGGDSTGGSGAGGQVQTTVEPPQQEVNLGEVDYFSRPPFKIAYICNTLTWAWNNALDQTLTRLGQIMNFEYTGWAANFDFDAYANQIYVFYDMGYDGLILGVDDTLAARAYEICSELDIAFVAESTAFMDDNGLCIWPSVQQANYVNGVKCVDWLADHYRDYWGEIDTSKLGLLVLDFSTVSGITERTPGAHDSFKSHFPEAAGNIFEGDLLIYGTTGFSVQGGNDMAMSIFANNPEIEKWFVVGNVDDWATGATRAAEALQMEDRVLAVSVQADAFLNEMAAGYTGNVYVAAAAISSTEFAMRMAESLVTILEGRETAETLWPEWRDPGGQYPRYQISGEMITRDTYQAYLTADAALLQN